MPEFLVIGPPRTGTTWLYNILKLHPDCYLPETKQLHYFDRHYDKGLEWYTEQFQKGGGLVKGEITPDYVSNRKSLNRISKTIPDVRLILIFRDPIERAFSHYKLRKRMGYYDNGKTFMDVFSMDPYLMDNSLYGKHLDDVLEYFSAEQVLIITHCEMLQNPLSVLSKVMDFIGLASYCFPEKELFSRYSQSFGNPRMVLLEKLLKKVRKIADRNRLSQKIVALITKLGIVNKTRQLNTEKKIELNSHDRQVLNGVILDDMKKFEDLIETRGL